MPSGMARNQNGSDGKISEINQAIPMKKRMMGTNQVSIRPAVRLTASDDMPNSEIFPNLVPVYSILMRKLTVAVLLALPLAGCGESSDVVAAKTEVEATIHAWHDLYDAGNIEALGEMIDPEVSFPVPPSQFLQGKDAVYARIQKDMQDYVISRDFQGKRKTLYDRIVINVNGNLAVARYGVNITDPGGVSAALFTRVFRKAGGKWLLLSEHYTVTPLTTIKPPDPKK